MLQYGSGARMAPIATLREEEMTASEMSMRRGLRARTLIALGALAGVAAMFAGLAAEAEAKGKSRGGKTVKVMTRNVFLGADLGPALEATTLAGAIDASGEILNDVDASNFPERAKALAKEIKQNKPHLIGLQEVALWRDQTPSDLGAPPTGIGAPATNVRYDFLQLLLDRLKKRGAKYKVADSKTEFDAELPADTDGSDATGGFAGADLDGRLTMRDVILERKTKRLKVKKPDNASYDALLGVSVGGIPLTVVRGWQQVEATLKPKKGKASTAGKRGGNAKFRFVNTHLEAFDASVRESQAKELIADGGPADTKKQVILVGDLNSGLPKHEVFGEDQLAFKALKQFGFKDRGTVHSCCVSDLISSPPSEFDHTVDHVLTNPGLRKLSAKIVGEEKKDKTKKSGLWPSDHAGVVSKLKLK